MVESDIDALRQRLSALGALGDGPGRGPFFQPVNSELQYARVPDDAERLAISYVGPESPLAIDTALMTGDAAILDGAVKASGIEALAWYVSYHHAPTGQWGIYVRESGVLYLATRVLRGRATTLQARCALAFHYLLAHERAHHAVDRMATVWEELFHLPCYVRGARAPFKPLGADLPASHAPMTVSDYEEGYAVACSLQSVAKVAPGIRLRRAVDQLREHVATLPPAYARRAGPDDEFVLSHAYHGLQGLGSRLPTTFDASAFFGERQDRTVPIYLLRDAEPLGLASGLVIRPYPRVSAIDEHRNFQKQLERIGRHYPKRWEKVKRLLNESTGHPGLNFEQIGIKGYFTVRLDRAIRVALIPPSSPKDSWTAIAAGTHDQIYGR